MGNLFGRWISRGTFGCRSGVSRLTRGRQPPRRVRSRCSDPPCRAGTRPHVRGATRSGRNPLRARGTTPGWRASLCQTCTARPGGDPCGMVRRSGERTGPRGFGEIADSDGTRSQRPRRIRGGRVPGAHAPPNGTPLHDAACVGEPRHQVIARRDAGDADRRSHRVGPQLVLTRPGGAEDEEKRTRDGDVGGDQTLEGLPAALGRVGQIDDEQSAVPEKRHGRFRAQRFHRPPGQFGGRRQPPVERGVGGGHDADRIGRGRGEAVPGIGRKAFDASRSERAAIERRREHRVEVDCHSHGTSSFPAATRIRRAALVACGKDRSTARANHLPGLKKTQEVRISAVQTRFIALPAAPPGSDRSTESVMGRAHQRP